MLRIITLLGLLINFIPSMPVNAIEGEVVIFIDTTPHGAVIEIDGEEVGATPLNVTLEDGKHQIALSASGFEKWSQEMILIENQINLLIKLEPLPGLIPVYGPIRYESWSSQANQLSFATLGEASSFVFYQYDATSQLFSLQSEPLDLISSDSIPSDLSISSDRTRVSSIAYESPSGRYIGYVNELNDTDYAIAIWDNNTLETRETKIFYPSLEGRRNSNNVIILPTFRLTWSQDESIIRVNDPTFQAVDNFILLSEDTHEEVKLFSFKDEMGQDVPAGTFIDFVPDTSKILLRDSRISQVWIVDLTTQQGELLPVEGVLGARLLDEATLLIARDREFVLYDINQEEEIERFDSPISESWEIESVDFSASGQFVLVVTNRQDSMPFWIYEMPDFDR